MTPSLVRACIYAVSKSSIQIESTRVSMGQPQDEKQLMKACDFPHINSVRVLFDLVIPNLNQVYELLA